MSDAQAQLAHLIGEYAARWFAIAPDEDIRDGGAEELCDLIWAALGAEEEWRRKSAGFVPMAHPMAPGADYGWNQPFWDSLWQGFFALRDQHGYFLVDDVQCCQTCSWAMVPDEQADKAVFYHHQDRNDFKESGYTCLTWQGDAALIRQMLEAQGLAVEHNGSVSERIKVMPSLEDEA